MLVALFVTLYIAVALLNMSIVQSIAGSIASSYLSKDWGGTVRVGSMGINLANGVTLRGVQLITPANDTIANIGHLTVRFNSNPIQNYQVHLKSVFLTRAYFHLEYQEDELTIHQFIKFISQKFAGRDNSEEETEPHHLFVLKIDNIYASHISYKQTLTHFADSTSFPGIRVPNMWFTDVNFKARSVRIDTSPRVTLRLDRFSAQEASGMNVRGLTMNAYVAQDAIAANDMELKTDSSNIKCDVLMEYHSFNSFEHFLDSVVMHVTLKDGTSCNMADAAYWTDALWGMHEQVKMRGVVYGPVANMRVRYMDIATGLNTQIALNGSVIGLPDIDNTLFDANIQNVTTNYGDLAALSWSDIVKVEFPALIAQLGNIDAIAGFHGKIKDFEGNVSARTDAGNILASVEMRYDDAISDYRYTAAASSPGFQLTKVVKNEWVSRSGFDATVQGAGFRPKTLTAQADIELRNTQVRGVPIDVTNAKLDANNGILTAKATLNDSLVNASLWAMADLRDSISSYEVSGMMRYLDLNALHLWNREGDSAATIKGQLQTHVYGNSLESLYGSMVLDNIELTLNHQPLKMKSAAMTIRTAEDYKNIFLASDICNAWVKGYFQYSDLPLAIHRFAENYIPQYFQPKSSNPQLAAARHPSNTSKIDPKTYKNKKTSKHNSKASYQTTASTHSFPDTTLMLADMDMEFGLKWKDTLDVMALLMPQIMIAPGTSLHGNYNYAEQLKIVLRSDSITIGGAHLYDMGMNGNLRGNSFGIDLHSERLALSTATLMEDMRLTAQSNSSEAGARLVWDNHSAESRKKKQGNIALRMISSDTGNWLQMTQGTMSLNGDNWQLGTKTPVFLSKERLMMEEVKGQCGDQIVLARASRVHDSSDFAEFAFQQFDLKVLSSLLQSTGIDIAGDLTGNVELQGLNDKPYLQADLRIDSTALGRQPLGVTRVLSSWNPGQDIVSLYLTTALTRNTGTIAPVIAVGELDVGKKDGMGLNFDVEFNSFQLQLLQPMLSNVLSELRGGLRGNFNISGTTNKPVVDGVAYIDNGTVKMDMLNARYTFDDSINIDNKAITLNRFALHDSLGNVAYLDGNIKHEYLHNFDLNLSLSTDKLLIMNTGAKSSNYYGTVFAAVDGRVTGKLNDLDVYVNARTRPRTYIVAPFDQKKSVKEEDYIQFVNPYNDAFSQRRSRNNKAVSNNRYHVVANITVTPDAELRLPVDYSQMLVDIHAKGGGDLEVTIGNELPLNILGEYKIEGGTLDLSLMSLVGRKFSIEEGSVITFPGAINNAMFDIRAIYSQRVNLSTLTGSLSTNASQTKVQVENVIAVTGNLNEPAISLDIRLPNAEQNIQDEVFSYIDRSNEKDIMNQTMSLLLLSQFYNANRSDIGSGVNSGSSLVANSIGSVVSSMIDFVDVNIDYKSATSQVNEQVEVDIAKQWNKFYFEGAFGYGGIDRTMGDVSIGNNLIGDMLLGYKFSPTLHLYVFNRSNTNNYTRSDLPYKQGVGLRFTKDFDRFGDLFRSQKRILEIKEQEHRALQLKRQAARDSAAATTMMTDTVKSVGISGDTTPTVLRSTTTDTMKGDKTITIKP